MANQTTNQLASLSGETIDRSADSLPVWDNSDNTTKKIAAQDVVTTGLQDPTGATTTRVNKVVALDQADYDAIVTKDDETLYVISDGQTDAERINDILQTSADFAAFKTAMGNEFGTP